MKWLRTRKVFDRKFIDFVEGEDWQPEGFENGIPIPAAFVEDPGIRIDGRDDEAAWEGARETELSLALGTVDRAWVKAVYTDEEVYIRVRWPDSSESREHHPWTWDAEEQQYVAGPQVEDSLLLSFESGCEWTPSLLGGYQYDFDYKGSFRDFTPSALRRAGRR